MNIPFRSKFQRRIKICSLFFPKRTVWLNTPEYLKKKIDSFLSFRNFETDLNIISMDDIIYLFEFEMITLPAFKPKTEIIFEKGEVEFLDNLQIFFLKKSMIFCFNCLPVFKRENPLQCEIFKFEFVFKSLLKADKICLKEFFEKKNFFRANNFFQTQKYNLQDKTKQSFFSNGFMEFNIFPSCQKNRISIGLILINKSLIRLNRGPEFRLNFRF